jgi:hypothetical protein
VGCNSTLQPFFAKYASASGDRCTLARAENQLLASFLENELRFIFREDVRGAIVLLRQFLLPLQHFAGQAILVRKSAERHVEVTMEHAKRILLRALTKLNATPGP